MNVLLLQVNDAYNGERYSTSQLKKNIDNARTAGIKKVIVCDSLFYKQLSAATYPLYGTPTADVQKEMFLAVYGDTNTHTEAELRTIIRNRLKRYIHEDVFYGVQLMDEPKYQNIEYTALTYKLIKEEFFNAKAELEAAGTPVAAKDIYIQTCLWAYHETSQGYFNNPDWNLSGDAAYERYLTTYLDISGADNITMDEYPMLTEKVSAQHFNGLRILAEVANRYGVTLGGVACSSVIYKEDGVTVNNKAPDKSDMYYQVNSYMMFHFDALAYYTYWSKGADTDGTTFIDRDGTVNDLYYDMQDINAEVQKLANILQYYQYNAVKCYSDNGIVYGDALYQLTQNDRQADSFAKVNISVSGGDAVATEMVGKTDSQNYLYAVMNANPPLNGTDNAGSDITVTLDFSGYGYTSVSIFFEGEITSVALVNGKAIVTLQAGSAAYVIPVK